MKPKISILITCYNKEKYISYILQQLIDQNRDEIFVHIIDDYSTDRSLEIAEELVSDIPNFKIYRFTKNHGTGFIRNFALTLVDTDWFIFIDADDMLVENYVELLLRYIDCDEYADIHHFRTRMYPIGATVMFNFSLWDRIFNTAFVKNNNLTFNSTLTNMEDFNFKQRIDRVPHIEKQHEEILYIYNVFAEDTVTHENPLWYYSSDEELRDACSCDPEETPEYYE